MAEGGGREWSFGLPPRGNVSDHHREEHKAERGNGGEGGTGTERRGGRRRGVTTWPESKRLRKGRGGG